MFVFGLSFVRFSTSFLFWLLCLVFALAWLPTTWAQNTQPHPFPNPTFKVLSDFILSTFNSNISLTTVLLLLFSLTNNPDLLNLHACQCHPVYHNERTTLANGWIRALACGIEAKLGDNKLEIYSPKNLRKQDQTGEFAQSLGQLAIFLDLTPYSQTGQFKCKIHHISRSSILPIYTICPPIMSCTTSSCKPYSIKVSIPLNCSTNVTLIEGITVTTSESVYLLSGECTQCKTHYCPDSETYPLEDGQTQQVFINSARYLKIGASVWVDRVFANAVLGGMYKYWNECFGRTSITLS
jgi:hypothetical protein